LTTGAFRCVLCGEARGVARWRGETWNVVACNRCGLLRTWPPPPAEILNEIYERPDYHADRSSGWSNAPGWRERARRVLAVVPSQPTAVLDFGAGPGHLVRALREEGLAAEGVEPYDGPRFRARRDHGIDLAPRLQSAWTQSFDVVTLIHSLEHVEDPVRTLSELRMVLKPGGWIFAEVPHAGGTGMWRRGTRRELMDLPAHLHHFTPRTFSAVVERAGFEISRVELFNCSEVETLLALRRRRSAGTSGSDRSLSRASSTDDGNDRASRYRHAAHGVARPAAQAVLGGLRLVAPGYKFCALARKVS
jgi:SAM-dependent methyltransferase